MLSPRAVARRRHVNLGHFFPAAAGSRRRLQTKTVTADAIKALVDRPLHPLQLSDLCRHGRPPLDEKSLIDSANFTLGILPIRLARRIQSLRALPYIVVANPNVSKIHSNYVHSLSTLLPYAETRIESLEDEVRFTEVMADLVQTHNNTIAVLARGFLEARKYISKEDITRFLDEHLRARIGTRLIAEQHIALHFSSKAHRDVEDHSHDQDDSYIGVIDTALRPADIIRSCEHTVGEICELKYGVRPTVHIMGSPETTITHIPMHLEYIITELLKNSFRATIEAGMEREPIEITIAPAPAAEEQTTRAKLQQQRELSRDQGEPINTGRSHDQSNVLQDLAASADIHALGNQTPGVTIRIRDRGGGIKPEDYANLWEYGFTTFNEDEILDKVSGGGGAGGGNGMAALDVISGGAGGGSSLAGLGYGLPLGRAYAQYFGGDIAVQSMWGWGTDVYLGLRGVGKMK